MRENSEGFITKEAKENVLDAKWQAIKFIAEILIWLFS